MIRRVLIWGALAVPLFAACGDDTTTPTTATPDVAADTSDAATTPDAVADAVADADSPDAAPTVDVETDVPDPGCESPGPIDTSVDTTPDPTCGADWVVFVEGTIVDDAGRADRVRVYAALPAWRRAGRGRVPAASANRSGRRLPR